MRAAAISAATGIAASALLFWYLFRNEDEKEETKDGRSASRRKRHLARGADRKEIRRPLPAGLASDQKAGRVASRLASARKNCIPSMSKILMIAEQCRLQQKKWKDDRFPHDDKSLFKHPSNPPKDWLREGERTDVSTGVDIGWQPPEHFCAGGHPLSKSPDGKPTWLHCHKHDDQSSNCLELSAEDIVQGSLGESFFLCALAAAINDVGICDDLIDGEFEDCGIYGVSLFINGKWQMIWVDSLFPCFRPKANSHLRRWRPMFAHCAELKEIWIMVVEKAFAKACGSYEALNDVSISQAMAMLAGGEAATFDLDDPTVAHDQIFNDIILSSRPGGQWASEIFLGGGSRSDLLHRQAKGIIARHAYTILDAVYSSSGSRLLKLRNPWGEGEWHGSWSDRDYKWSSEEGKSLVQELGITRHECSLDDCEFWIEFADFVERFRTVEWCALSSSEEHEVQVRQLKQLSKRQARQQNEKTGRDAGLDAPDERSLDELVREIKAAGKRRRAGRHSSSRKHG